MNQAVRGARPIKSLAVQKHYESYSYEEISIEAYSQWWRAWLSNTDNKSLNGLENFSYSDYTQGTSQTFDHFVLRHSADRRIVNFIGDFQYHSCISKKQNFKSLSSLSDLCPGQALIISLPFSDFGKTHPDFYHILESCNKSDIPVCLDLAYWGISKNVMLELDQYPCIKEITSSLSKPFYTLENHRCGVRFSRDYLDDGISMINEVRMQNFFSMGLAVHYMNMFDADWIWRHYGSKYLTICDELEVDQTDTIIFGTSKHDKYAYLNRGVPGNNRVCISEFFKDIIDNHQHP